MKRIKYRLIEMLVIFVLAPISMVLPISIGIKIAIGIVGFLYVLVIMLGVERINFRIEKTINWKRFWKLTCFKFLGIVIITLLYILVFEPGNLFKPLVKDYRIWLMFCFIYSLFSVYPQELLYRTFFFKRYQGLFKNRYIFILVNAALFSLAHLFFGSVLVMVFTFIGGLLFVITFEKTKSTVLVSIEHSIYGCWLFTVGMGEMLGFPL